MTMTVDEFVSTRIQPELHDIVAALRGLVRECAPGATEAVSYDMPCFIGRNIFAYINTSKEHVTFSFVRGVQIDDTHRMLKGRAKHARFVKLKRVSDIQTDALCDYVRQAVALDAR
ncbi:MAG: DUF1801 domain-containing protein [Anaerolineae bacterium]|nr:DUF1801 domain-containing protein [Anaerolineae bacterium]